MKKTIMLILACLMAMLVLAGCSAKNSADKPVLSEQLPETPAPEAEVTEAEDAAPSAESAEPEAVPDDGQNPVMNFIGQYQCDRAHALVEAVGEDGARITIDWGSSAWETARWEITGTFDVDTLTIEYTDCVKSILTTSEDGESESVEVVFEDGTGTIVFGENGTFSWHDDQSEYGEDMLFEWLSIETLQDGESAEMANPWRDISENEAKEICPDSFGAPEGAENISWSVLDSAADPSGVPGALVQLAFELYGNTFTAREQVTGDPEADISGMYYDWNVQDEFSMENWNGKDLTGTCFRYIGEGEYADLCIWFDAESGITYSLGVTAGDLDGFDLQAVAEAMGVS